ncbi:RNA-binding protein [Enterococcus pallens]|uniref:S4 domain-containing protein n=1 Tax=Enterococcus pallens ATCC BAA-351 TaxID=1158607 RepID=R2PTA5_9ENTE|nr:RNA-binding protein [Enterococcus pallens]EOH87822.1 S4 domain-containing protein [Enterococcus pallens ATCC BAA-351]EOU18036.1 S4 domain-containing protein [Enterococcus pallens ATCC BAA-351]OJG82340.1 S4 domain-containing protein [Enterococcus pallens]
MNENVYQHFRPEERPFIDAVGDWLEQVESQYAPYLTSFLDPRQAYILETLTRENSDLKFMFFGGYEQAERCRCMIYPEYFEPSKDDFEIITIEIKYPQKFTELSHGKVLGTLMNVGIKRDYFGDIISDGKRWQVFLARETSNFIESQITKIGRVTVHLEEKLYTEIIVPKDSWSEEITTASSLRLDVIISTVYNISRQRSKQLVESGKVKVNWSINERSDYLLDLLDVISIRGFGRIQIQAIEGKTKKEKIRLRLGVLRK